MASKVNYISSYDPKLIQAGILASAKGMDQYVDSRGNVRPAAGSEPLGPVSFKGIQYQNEETGKVTEMVLVTFKNNGHVIKTFSSNLAQWMTADKDGRMKLSVQQLSYHSLEKCFSDKELNEPDQVGQESESGVLAEA